MTSPEHAWRTAYRHPGPWDQPIPPMSMVDALEASARRNGNAPLLDFMGRKFNFAEVLRGANRVACGLRDLGYGPGDRIGLFLPNVPHYVAAYYGILKLGATVVNFSPLYSVDELASQVADSGTRLIFTLNANALLPTALAVLDKSALEHLVVGSVAGGLSRFKSVAYRTFKSGEFMKRPSDPRVKSFSSLIANNGDCPAHVINPEQDLALIQYTGGTTGVPKGAMLTHQNLCANARQVAALDPGVGGSQYDDRVLGVLPFFHVFANTCVLNRSVLTGGEIIMLPRFDAAGALDAINRTRPTALPGVPTMFQALIDHPKSKSTDWSSLVYCISGGAPLPAELKARFKEETGASLIEGYGLSESSGVVSANPYQAEGKSGSIGQPLIATRVRLVDKEDPSQEVANGEPGEITVAGPQIMAGYWNRPEVDDSTFCYDATGQRWLRTGDVGQIDEDGFIRIVDRLKDMISVGGFKVFPKHVEEVLYRHPAIKEVLVVGMPEPRLGEVPRAYVALNDASDPVSGEELRNWLNPQVGKHERVDAVVIRSALPKTMIGKLSRKDLLLEIAAESGANKSF